MHIVCSLSPASYVQSVIYLCCSTQGDGIFSMLFVPSMFYVLMKNRESTKQLSLQRKTHKESSGVSMLLLLFPRSLVLEKGFSCSSMLHTSKSLRTHISLILRRDASCIYIGKIRGPSIHLRISGSLTFIWRWTAAWHKGAR